MTRKLTKIGLKNDTIHGTWVKILTLHGLGANMELICCIRLFKVVNIGLSNNMMLRDFLQFNTLSEFYDKDFSSCRSHPSPVSVDLKQSAE